MASLHDLDDFDLPLEERLTLGLEFAIAMLNLQPSFPTHIPSPHDGRLLSSYRVLARLDPLLREAKTAYITGPRRDSEQPDATP